MHRGGERVSGMLSQSTAPAAAVAGKFLTAGGRHFLIKGVSYGTFAPDANGCQYPDAAAVARDFARMREAGINTVRTYTAPPEAVLDEAARQHLRVIAGAPWPQHVAFLDDPRLTAEIRRGVAEEVRRVAGHPAVLLSAVGNEIPASVVRWHGYRRIEAFLRELHEDAKAAAPDALVTYVNYPPTHFLDLPWFDVCAFNVYLHDETALRAYIAQLHHVAGCRPLLLTEAGADAVREGAERQAALTAMQLRAAFAGGACGAVAFTWTDEWWRGGQAVDDWAFGLVDAERRPKPALSAVARAFAAAPFPAADRSQWPMVSVLVCAYNAAGTLADCLDALEALDYPAFEIILVNDGSTDDTSAIARRYRRVRVVDTPPGGLSVARNVALAHATGEIVAYTDADVRVHPQWLTYLVQPFRERDVAGAGGPNVVPPDDPWLAQCVARAPGAPTHVMLDDVIAEHVPGCNMAFRREALLALGGFNPIFGSAADDVDVCWRFQAVGAEIGFAPAAFVWHHHRSSVRAYWRQQFGYGKSEAWLTRRHPEKFVDGRARWSGRIYSPLPWVLPLGERRINAGVWGMAPFPSVYHAGGAGLAFLPHQARWQVLSALLVGVGCAGVAAGFPRQGTVVALLGALAFLTTVARCVERARRVDIDALPRIGKLPRSASRVVYRATIAALHVLQPLARGLGRVRGFLSPPGEPHRPVLPHGSDSDAEVADPALRDPSVHGLRVRDLRRALRLARRQRVEDRFWSERWVARPVLLGRIVRGLRGAPVGFGVETDDGWQRYDFRIHAARWGRLDLLTVIEEHAQGRCLLRTRMRLRVSPFALTLVAALAATSGVTAGLGLGTVAVVSGALAAGMAGAALRRLARVVPAVRLAVARAARGCGFEPLDAPELAEGDEAPTPDAETLEGIEVAGAGAAAGAGATGGGSDRR